MYLREQKESEYRNELNFSMRFGIFSYQEAIESAGLKNFPQKSSI